MTLKPGMKHNEPDNGCDCGQCVGLMRALDPTSFVNQSEFVRFMIAADGPEQPMWALAYFFRGGQ